MELRKSLDDESAVARLKLVLREAVGVENLAMVPRLEFEESVCEKPNPRAGYKRNAGRPNGKS